MKYYKRVNGEDRYQNKFQLNFFFNRVTKGSVIVDVVK